MRTPSGFLPTFTSHMPVSQSRQQEPSSVPEPLTAYDPPSAASVTVTFSPFRPALQVTAALVSFDSNTSSSPLVDA
eukprot:CAMPEP_0173254126 /NCGR_PEP_ID=MMETSP1142-20121109/21744_1 /TAXON_ID=483371 /ORGANISM="non described non described, Strain CCMP2298" /LENGTH=75 /DNA_ID=CAMNT_0014187515 /DNA_START=408 /DNA_END=631 /DNA_ORIENTATION=-